MPLTNATHPLSHIAGITATVCLLALPLLPLVSRPVEAAFPGYNGKVLFTSNRDGHKQLYVMNPDGSGQINISHSAANDSGGRWSPDGQKIAFWSDRDGNQEVYVMNADGSHQTRLTVDPGQDAVSSWSPDGTRLVFQSNRLSGTRQWVMNADGSNPTCITCSFPTSGQYNAWWSPNGQRIAVQYNGTGKGIYLLNPDGSNVTQLTVNPAGVTDQVPIWSPDGGTIYFGSNRSGETQLWAMNPDGSHMRQVTVVNGYSSTYTVSPDGSALLRRMDPFSGAPTGTLVVERLADHQLTSLTSGLYKDDAPDWQPVPNKPPVTAADTLSVTANSTASAAVLANDADEQALDPQYLTITTAPTHGTATIKDGKVSYTPAQDYIGADQLTYQICDSFLLDQQCATAVLNIIVSAAPVSPTPTPSLVSAPTVTSIGTIQLHGAETIYFTGHRPTVAGTAEPGAVVTVTIHSDPIVLTTTADNAGTWSVTPDQDIPNGQHQVIVTATKDGQTSEALNLVLGINVGLAETGTPLWPVSVLGLLGLVATREGLRRRSAA